LKEIFRAHDVIANELYSEEAIRYTPSPQESDYTDDETVDNSDLNELTMDVTRIRLVQFQKNSGEPMGITLKLTDDSRVVVARILVGGMIYKQGTLHVGDEIKEINNVDVASKSIENLQKTLRDSRGNITFKIIPSYRNQPPPCEVSFLSAHSWSVIDNDKIEMYFQKQI
jgi:calcium/calmodulin-dependent serine protein kinase